MSQKHLPPTPKAVLIGCCYRRQCGRNIFLDPSISVALTRYEHAPQMNNFTVKCSGCHHETRFFLDALPIVDGEKWLYNHATIIATHRLLPSRKCARVYKFQFGTEAPMPTAGLDIDAVVERFAATINNM